MAYRYRLVYATKELEISSVSSGKIIVEKEEGEIFTREKFSGTIAIEGEGYNFLIEAKAYANQCCQEIRVIIDERCHGSYSLIWEGYFTLHDIEWDYFTKTAEVKKINPRDKYDKILRNWHKEINLMDNPERETIMFQGYLSYPAISEFNPTGANWYEGFTLIQAIQYVAKETLSGSGGEDIIYTNEYLISQFFTAPVNYVTGKANYLAETMIMHMSDAKRPAAANPARIGKISLKTLLQELKTLFSAYWYIDSVGKFKIEHLSYFDPSRVGTTIDLTHPLFKDITYNRLKVFDKTDLLKGVEGLEIAMNVNYFENKDHLTYLAVTSEFSKSYITYSSSCVPYSNKGEIIEEIKTCSIFFTDFIACWTQPGKLPEEGWVLVQHRWNGGGSGGIVGAKLTLSGDVLINANLSATRLHKDFGLYDASFGFGVHSTEKEKSDNSSKEMFRSIRTKGLKKIKVLQDIELANCCTDQNYDFSGLIKHPLADSCSVDKLEFDLTTQTITASPVAADICNDIPIPEESDDDAVPPTGCERKGTFLRNETIVLSTPIFAGNNTIAFAKVVDIYADGFCGEYEVIRKYI